MKRCEYLLRYCFLVIVMLIGVSIAKGRTAGMSVEWEPMQTKSDLALPSFNDIPEYEELLAPHDPYSMSILLLSFDVFRFILLRR